MAGGLGRYFSSTLNLTGTRLVTTNTGRHLLCLAWPSGEKLWETTLPALAPSLLSLPNDGRFALPPDIAK